MAQKYTRTLAGRTLQRPGFTYAKASSGQAARPLSALAELLFEFSVVEQNPMGRWVLPTNIETFAGL